MHFGYATIGYVQASNEVGGRTTFTILQNNYYINENEFVNGFSRCTLPQE